LNSGRYRLRATADPANWFAELNNTNNSTWVNIRLTNSDPHG
jgi:subtilase family serine protease